MAIIEKRKTTDGQLQEYNLCRFIQEDDGTMVLLLFGQRHIGPKKAK